MHVNKRFRQASNLADNAYKGPCRYSVYAIKQATEISLPAKDLLSFHMHVYAIKVLQLSSSKFQSLLICTGANS